METLINLAIILLAVLGTLYALGLGIAFIALGGDKDLLEEDSLYCDCQSCSLELPGKNGNPIVCSSECDDLCRKENHYEGQEWRCHY